MALRAVIFDFDGLILDTETPEVRAWQKIFRSRGAEFPDAYWIHAIGRGADQIQETPVELLERQLGYPCVKGEIEAEYERLRLSAIEASECLTGIRELIRELKSAGLKLGVASSSRHQWVDRHLFRLGLFNEFQAIVCADDVELAKPFPDLYLAACQQLGVDPSETIAIEDSPNGIRAARSAGLICIVIPNPCTVQLNLSEASHRVDTAKDISHASLSTLLESGAAEYAQPMITDLKSERIQSQFNGIVQEMKNLGIWDIVRPSDQAFNDMGAFGMNTMALEQWLRWVFVPTLEDRLASNGPWPGSSSIGTVALRNFDGQYEKDELVRLLNEFDRLF